MPPPNKIDWIEIAALVMPALFVILLVTLLIAG